MARTAPARAKAPALSLSVQYASNDGDLPARPHVRRWVRAALIHDATVTVRFVDAIEGRALNAEFRGKDYATNVLTFVYDDENPRAGDVVLCAPVVRREAAAQGKPLADHHAHLVVHGMLHLQGFDHERHADAAVMEARETAILAALGLPDPYAVRNLTPMDNDKDGDKPTLLERISALLMREPEDRDDLIAIMRGAFERKLVDGDALSMIEGVLSVSETTVRDIMIPRAQMDCVSIDDDPAEFMPLVVETRHSRFPVIGESKDDIVGILLAKELLNYYANPEAFNLHDTLRPAVFVPESKRLNVLLREFRANRNHIAIVVDEYGGVSGLVTIEDVLEQIVGDIEDEYDFDESEDNIIPEASGRWRVKAQTEIADFNAHFGTKFDDDEFDTVGGLVLRAFGRLPKRGETAVLEGLRFRVLRADSRRLYTLQVERLAPPAGADGTA